MFFLGLLFVTFLFVILGPGAMGLGVSALLLIMVLGGAFRPPKQGEGEGE